MSTSTIDYDALAAQNGGSASVDYDALAAQHGGNAIPAAHQEALGLLDKASKWDMYKQALFNPAGSGANAYPPAVEGALQVGGRALQGAYNTVAHPLDALAGIANSVAHPIDTAKARVDEFENEWKKSPSLALENAGGDIIGTVEGGRLGGAAAGKVADAIGPAAGRVALLGKTPAEAYESALKPSTTLPPSVRASIVKTGLDQAIPVSKAGLEKIGDRIDELNQTIKATIDADPNRPIDPNAVATRADAAKAKFAKQVNAQGDLNAIDASKQQFLNEQGATATTPAPPMGAADAQAMKQGTYRVLSGKFGEQGSASVEAQKALARGLKEEIATQFPEIGNLNAQESKLLDLQPVLERAVSRISNHQLIGIGTPIAGTAVKAVSGSTSAGAVAMALKSVVDNPMVKSRLAIALSKGAKIPYAQAAAKIGAYSAALGSTISGPQEYSNGGSPNQPTTPQP